MNKGKITQVIGPVVDVEFESGRLPGRIEPEEDADAGREEDGDRHGVDGHHGRHALIDPQQFGSL